MGWLVMWAAVFMLTTTYMVDFRFERRDQYDVDRAAATASQMFIWHKAAVNYCAPSAPYQGAAVPASPCEGMSGPLDVGSIAGTDGDLAINGAGSAAFEFGIFKDAHNSTFASGRFVSVVDSVKGVVATYYNDPLPQHQHFEGMIVSQMSQGRNWSPTMGFYNKAAMRVSSVMYVAGQNQALAGSNDLGLVPATIGGSIPDQAPIVMTTYK